jgi:hypothetical protein
VTTFAGVQAHFFNAGAAVTGVAPNGVDSNALETTMQLRGRYRKWTACTDGGLFGFDRAATVHESPSGALRQVIWSLPGVTNVTFAWIDMDGLVVPWNINAGAQGLLDMQQNMLFMPRGYLRISATGAVGLGGGSIVTTWEKGIQDDPFAHLKTLGSMALP